MHSSIRFCIRLSGAAARLAEQTQRGWHKALYCALSDGENISLGQKVKPKSKKQKEDEVILLDIFDFVND